MRIIFNLTATVVVFFTLVSTSSYAQFQVNASGIRAVPIQQGATFDDGTWGGGVTVRYFTSPHVAVGLSARYFTQRNSFGSGSLQSRSRSLITTGQVEYFFSTTRLRPYAGLEAGLYSSYFTLNYYDYNSNSPISLSGASHNFGVSPKVGLQYAISQSVGVNAELGYHYVFDGNDSHIATLSAGAFVKFGRQ